MTAPVHRMHPFLKYVILQRALALAHCQAQDLVKARILKGDLYLNGAFLEGVIKDAGFVDVEVRYEKLYSGTWGYGKSPTFR